MKKQMRIEYRALKERWKEEFPPEPEEDEGGSPAAAAGWDMDMGEGGESEPEPTEEELADDYQFMFFQAKVNAMREEIDEAKARASLVGAPNECGHPETGSTIV